MTPPPPPAARADTPPTSTGVPPAVLISGPEEVLAQRALASTLDALRATDPGVEVVRLSGAAYEPGSIGMHASPSLFGGTTAIVVHEADEGGDELVTDVLAYLGAPAEHVTLVIAHRGGNRGKKMLDALTAARARVLDAPAIKTDREKSEFVATEFRRARRKASPEAIRALVEAVGKDVAELAAACAQLVADTEGVIDEKVVETYHGGRIEATGFRVADAAIAGQTGEALALLRHALAAGVDPVPIVAVLAVQLRQLVKVAGAPRGSGAALARSLEMAPWQIDRARRALAGWDLDGLGAAIQAVAAADFAVKGGGRDPEYAVERCLLEIGAARRGR